MARNNLTRKLANAQSAIKSYVVSVPQEVADEYAKAALGADSIEDILSNRLTTCYDHTSDKPLYWTDTERRELELLLNANFSSPAQVLEKLRQLFSVVSIEHLDDTATITLTPDLIYRLEERARMLGRSIAEAAKKFAEEGLKERIGY